MRSTLWIPHGEDVLAATLHVPDGVWSVDACVLFLAGPATNRGGPNRLHHRAAIALEHVGVPSLRFDYRGRGESTGDEESVCVPTMIEDTLAAKAAAVRALGATPGRFVLVANCLACVAELRVLESAPDVSGGVFVAATQFAERQDTRHFWSELRYAAGAYSRKLVAPDLWRRVLEGKVDYAAVGRALFNSAARRYRSRIADPSRRRYGIAPALPGKDARFLWGAHDPSSEERAYYQRFCQERDWRGEFHVLPDADRSFGRAQSAARAIDVMVRWAFALARGAAPAEPRRALP